MKLRTEKEVIKLIKNIFNKSLSIISIFMKCFFVLIITTSAGVGSINLILWINKGLVSLTYATYASYLIAGLTFHLLFKSFFPGKEEKEQWKKHQNY